MKKLILISISIVVILLTAIIVIPIIFKDKIVELVKIEANKNVNAVVDFNNDIELSLFKSFPNFTLGINQLSVVGVNEFEGDTLIALKTFSATLDLMSVIKGDQIKVVKIVLDEPVINALVTKKGNANWDIAKPNTDTISNTPDTTTSKFNIALKKLDIKQATIVYNDKQSNMSARLINFNNTLTGDFSQDNFLLNIMMSCEQLSYKMDGIPYLSKVKLSLQADIDANMKDMKFSFKENKMALNELTFGFDGWVAMPGNDISMDIKYDAKQAEFKHFLSLIPTLYTKDFTDIKTSGKLAFNGYAKGIYSEKSLPAFAFNLAIEDAQFQYPSLPAPVNNIQLQFSATNPDGNLDNTKINLSKFHFEIMGDPFDMRLLATNVMKDPNIEAEFNGLLNFDNIVKIMPLEKGMNIAGLMTMNIAANGKLSTIEKEQYEQFDAKGKLALTKFMFASNDLPKPYYINNAELIFNPKTVTLNTFDAKIGNSDMQISGAFSNFFAYTFGKGTLKGVLNFKANQIDVNEFLTPTAENTEKATPIDTSSIVAPEIPSNIDFTLNATIEKLLYTNIIIEKFAGQIKMANAKLEFNKVALNTLGSKISMDGYYETSNPKKPTIDVDFGINNMEFKKAFQTFNTVKKIAPIAENMTGDFSTTFKLKSAVDQNLNPIYDDLFAEGMLNIPDAGFTNVKLFNKAAEVLKYEKLKNPTLSNVKIQFKVEKGRITTQPFDMNIANQKLTLSGYTGLDQTIAYTGKTSIPRSIFGSTNTATNTLLNEANAKAGTNVKLSEMIDVNLGLGGTFTEPKITSNLADILKNEATSLKNQLMDEASKKAKELEDKAKAQVDKIKKETEAKAKAQADKMKAQAQAEADKTKAKLQSEIDKANAEADKLKKETEAKAKAEEIRLKKLAEEEAKKKLKGIFGK